MNDPRARRMALLISLVIGLALGLFYTWVIAPVELVNTYPALLRTDYRQDWIRLAVLSYAVDGDLEQALARLNALKQEDVASAIQALIEEYAATGHPADVLRSMTRLARALNVYTPAMLVYMHTPTAPSSPPVSLSPRASVVTPTLIPPSPTSRALDTPSPQPTHTPTPTPLAPSPSPTSSPESTGTPAIPTPTPPLVYRLRLSEQELICRPEQIPHIEVVVRDERGEGQPGVVVWLTLPGGADRAVTGLKPENGAGYADFNAEPGVGYTLSVGDLAMPLVTDLRIRPCPDQGQGEPSMGSWRIVLAPLPPETRDSENDNEI